MHACFGRWLERPRYCTAAMAIGHAQTAQRLARLLSNNYSLLPSHSLSLSLSRVFVRACLFLPPSLQDDSPPPPASSSSSSPVYTLYLMLLVFPWLRGQSEDTPPAYIGHGETHLTGYSLDRTYCREQQSVPVVGSTHRPTGELVGRR